MLSQVHVKKKVYQSVLETVTSWHQVDQVRLIHDISRSLETTLAQDEPTMTKDVTSEAFQQDYDATIEAFQQVADTFDEDKPGNDQSNRPISLADIWAMLPANMPQLTDAELDQLKEQWRLEKYG